MMSEEDGADHPIMVTPAAEREAVAHLRTAFEMSEQRACKTIGCCRMTVRHKSSRGDDGDLRERMKAIAHERRRFGYRRLHVLLRRKVMWSITSVCSGSIARRSLPFGAVAAASGPLELEHR